MTEFETEYEYWVSNDFPQNRTIYTYPLKII